MTQPDHSTSPASHAGSTTANPPMKTDVGRGIAVHLFITLAAALFLGTVAVLFYRWVSVSEPRSMIVVQGNASLEGAKVKVSGLGLVKPLETTIHGKERFLAPVFLEPGGYTLLVTLDGREIFEENFEIHDRKGLKFDLSKMQVEPSLPAQPDVPE